MTVINREELAELIATATYRADHRTILPSTVYGLVEALETVLSTLPVEPEVEWEYGAANVDPDRPVSIRATLVEGRESQEFYTRHRGAPTALSRRTPAIPAGPWEVVTNE